MIQCIFFVEFDNRLGPVINYQIPDNFIDGDSRDLVTHLIPKKTLCNRIVTLEYRSSTIVGYPTYIDNEKYERNSFYFNIALAIDESESTLIYEPVVKKLSLTLGSLEREHSILSNRAKRVYFLDVLKQMLEGLNRDQMCSLFLYSGVKLNLKLYHPLPPCSELQPHQVPYPLVPIPPSIQCDADLSLQFILSFVDGENYIAKIAELAHMSVNLVLAQLRHLVFFRIIGLVDIFQFSNIYCFTGDSLFEEDRCLEFLSLVLRSTPNAAPEVLHPSVRFLPIYAAFGFGKKVCDAVEEFSVLRRLGGTVRSFVYYGVLTRTIRRVHEYPYVESGELAGLCTGERPIDDLCIALKDSKRSVMRRLEAAGACILYR